MAKNQFDWSILPNNSQTKMDKEIEFISGRKDNTFKDPKTGVFFKNMEGSSIIPPNEDKDEQEKSELNNFTPEKPENLITNDSEDIGEIVSKMYANDPNWEPVVERVGENEYRVSELRPKARREKYAENNDDEKTIERAKADGLVSANVEVEGSVDPYFDKRGVIDYSNDRFWEYNDFKKWTPGLERMFAPTLDTTNWL